jgi:phage terminase small subunit
MPALDNIRHERFARALIKTGVKATAYLKAGYTPTTRSGLDAAACRLARRSKVTSRIRELKKQMAARNRITVDSLIEELDEAKRNAQRLDQPSVEVTAVMSKARLTGLLVDRKEQGAPGDFTGLRSEADTLAKVERELGKDAAEQLAKALQAAENAPSALADDADPLPIEPTIEGSGTLN